MPVALYLDVHIPRAIPLGLRVRQVDVLTAQEDGGERLSDPQLLDRAAALGRVLFSFDRHFLIEAVRRQQQGNDFSGLVYAYPLAVSIGGCIQDLEIIAKAASPEEMANRVQFLPL